MSGKKARRVTFDVKASEPMTVEVMRWLHCIGSHRGGAHCGIVQTDRMPSIQRGEHVGIKYMLESSTAIRSRSLASFITMLKVVSSRVVPSAPELGRPSDESLGCPFNCHNKVAIGDHDYSA